MTSTIGLLGRGTPRTLLRAPWTARAWLDTAHIVTGLALAAVTVTILLSLGALVVGLAVTVVPALIALLVLFGFGQMFAKWQRARFAAFLGVRIESVSYRFEVDSLRGLVAAVRAGDVWRQIAYHLLSAVIAAVGFAAAVGAWSVGVALGTVSLFAWALSDNGVLGIHLHEPAWLLALTLIGLAALFAAPWVARGVVLADVALARTLLGPGRAAELAARVETLTESRAGVVDAADAERRRIERDLHDGAQQRLVSLAMNLGIARATLIGTPDPAYEAIEQAHDEAKEALKELRDLVRGLHPAVLSDEGLDAALSGVAARAPLPVRLRVDLPERPSPTIEAIAFFVVSEALTNVAKHARATSATITVEPIGGNRLLIMVADDGRGRADLDGGTGLRGLAQRVASIDGTLGIESPPGGPTLITVELPCVS